MLTIEDLASYFHKGAKPALAHTIGFEREVFLFNKELTQRLPYASTKENPAGIKSVLEAFLAEGGQAIEEKDHLIGIAKDKASLTIEPGGQFEYASPPTSTIHELAAQNKAFEEFLSCVCDALNIKFLSAGFDPVSSRENVPWMPKTRYSIMREFMLKKGSLGLDMMLRTATIQVALDYESEQDCVKKWRVAQALQPYATALFACSSIQEGKDTSWQSYRMHVWDHTDPDRCGPLDFLFEPTMGFGRYVDYLVRVPLYFVKRHHQYIRVEGTFHDFMQGTLKGLEGQYPNWDDFEDLITFVFPDVRLKSYLELRGADAGPESHIPALGAFWTGLLYDEKNLTGFHDEVMNWVPQRHHDLRHKAALHGVHASEGLRHAVHRLLTLCQEGLVRRQRLNESGQDESIYLEPLWQILHTQKSMADWEREKLLGRPEAFDERSPRAL